MGKKLIIKGADFTQNCIGDVTIPKLTELLVPMTTQSWGALIHGVPYKNTTPNRLSTDEIVDISQWAQRIGTVNLSPKAGYKIVGYFGNLQENDNISSWAYTEYGSTLTVNISNCSYALLQVAPIDSAALTSRDWTTYLTED